MPRARKPLDPGNIFVETTKRQRLQAAMEHIARMPCQREVECISRRRAPPLTYCGRCYARFTLKGLGVRKAFLKAQSPDLGPEDELLEKPDQ